MSPKLKAREFQFVNRLTCAHIEQLWRMYQGEWWSRGRNLNDVRRAVEHSDLICAYCDPATGRLAAFARVLTDFVYKAVIFDVIVDRPVRRLGLGRMLPRGRHLSTGALVRRTHRVVLPPRTRLVL